MGIKVWEVVCDENGTGGGGKCGGDNDAQLDRINVLYEAYNDLEPGMIDAAALSRRSANSSAREPS